MGRFPAQLLLLALTGLCLAREELELVTAVQGSPFSTRCYYNNYKYSLEEKFWCKMLSDQECNSRIFLTIRAKGEKYLNIAPKRRVDLTDSGRGWISVSMTELRIEDSGTYLCGGLYHQTIIPLKKIEVAVSYDAPMRLSAKKGDSISLNCSYFVMDDSRRPNNFTWCKMVNATSCQPVVSIKINQIVNTRERTRIKIDRWNRVIIVMLVALQLRDSGEYHCEAHLQGSTVLLKMITLNVLGKSVYYDTVNEATSPPTDEWETVHPTVASNKEQRILYVVLALGSFLVGSALIAIMAIIFTKGRKRVGNGLDFGEHPNCRLAAEQKDEGHPRDATPDGELKNSIIYAMLRLQPMPKPDDVTYANVEPPPKPKGAKHSAEPSAVLLSSGTMEYATIIFGDSPPQSGTKEKQTSPS
ncbi:lipoamide acyltransferase component of branched-chain alpha-keto acid dehydrogenase complex [Platysternon megacephalum]|uniref:Lipoamide acyltransferase component of branched-chain alpha-keto acid dehydrogenase complex n=1 Tax=Platysternon megacephalum TaxID=55544 RepID=A0A4D9E685_9SAUR|nr:lipoamide acyltransferase component of branched-chain alpha-keto acid dehydrogenase complex [Platysternon megacephalum]